MTVFSSDRRWSAETRICVFLFGLALAANVGISGFGWENNLLGKHEFRQIQTALTTQRFVLEGVKLNYETPLFGPPWEVPLELPLFQACVSWFVQATQFPLDQSGMLLSWIFFLSALPACFLLLGHFNLSAGRRLLMLSLLILSPIYLFFSRAFLIESTVLSFSCWFLLFFVRSLDRPTAAAFLGAAICGITAGTIKVTTFAVFLCAAGLFLIAALKNGRAYPRWRLAVRAGFALALPLLVTLWWTYHTSAVRHRNPEVSFLDSHFGYWSFGDLSMRLSAGFWLKTFQVWSDEIVSEAALGLLVFYYGCLRGVHRWKVTACLGVFLSGQLIFANLYLVHDYYFYGSALFLVAAVGFAMLELIDYPGLSRAGVWIFIGGLLGFQLNAYHRSLFEYQSTKAPVPEFVDLVNASTTKDEVVVMVGFDWDAMVPYYSARRAFMVLNGREYSLASLRPSLERLDPKTIGAVVIRGPLSRDLSFVQQAMPSFALGGQPLFIDSPHNVGIWIPESRHEQIRDGFDSTRFPSIRLSSEPKISRSPTLHQRQIRYRSEFQMFHPLPIQATTLNDFSEATVDNVTVLNCHTPTELIFRRGTGEKRLTGLYGLPPESYAHKDMTDGVEFAIFLGQVDGTETRLFTRLINPAVKPEDQGLQHLDLTVPAGNPGATLIFRTLPGPNNSAAYDWSFWAKIRIE